MSTYIPGVYTPPIGFYNQIKVNLTTSEIRQLVGRNGCKLKFLTRKFNLSYIWLNKEQNIIEIWGKTENLLPSKFGIQSYIDNFEFKQSQYNCNYTSADDLHFMSTIVDDIFEF